MFYVKELPECDHIANINTTLNIAHCGKCNAILTDEELINLGYLTVSFLGLQYENCTQ